MVAVALTCRICDSPPDAAGAQSTYFLCAKGHWNDLISGGRAWAVLTGQAPPVAVASPAVAAAPVGVPTRAPSVADAREAAAQPVLPAAPAVAAAPRYEVRLRSIAQFPATPVRWLWPGRIPRGALTIVEGDPGLGKSMLLLDLAARLSRGLPLPADDAPAPDGPADSLLLTAEDSIRGTVRPRLEAAGADLARVQVPEVVDLETGRRFIEIPTDLQALADVLRRCRARLLVIDPLAAFLAERVNAHKDQSVRRALAPLAALAEELDVAVVIIRHLNKGVGASATYRGGGSIGILGAARSGLLVAKDTTDPERRVLAPVKSNLCALPPALAYRIEQAGAVARVQWEGPVDVTADALLLPHQPSRRPEQGISPAQAWLAEQLAAGPRAARDLHAAAAAHGFTPKMLRRARGQLGVAAIRQGFGRDGEWVWLLPPTEG